MLLTTSSIEKGARALTMIVALWVPMTAAGAAEGHEPVAPEVERQLADDLDGGVQIENDHLTGAVRFVSAIGESGLLPELNDRTEVEQARAFVDRYGAIFGIRSWEAELTPGQRTKDDLGLVHQRYLQLHREVPVALGFLQFHFDGKGRLYAITGSTVPDLDLEVTPEIDPETAAEIALEHARRDQKEEVAEALQVRERARLTIVPSRLNGAASADEAPRAWLGWHVEIGDELLATTEIFVDAVTGEVVADLGQIYIGRNREIYEQWWHPSSLFWQEGDSTPTGIADADDLIDYSGHTYDFFANSFGIDGQDLMGGPVRSIFDVHGLPGIICLLAGPNAFWASGFAMFCPQMTTDDIVGHEFGHGYTESLLGGTNFVYQGQSGALSEAFADIFGESIDLLNLAGLDLPDSPRSEDSCSTNGPTVVGSAQAHFWNPGGSLYVIPHGFATFSPPMTTRLVGTLVLADDGVGDPQDACEPLVAPLASNEMVLVRQGSCPETQQVSNVQAAGGLVAILSNAPGQPAEAVLGSDPNNITPTVMVSGADGFAMRSHLEGGGFISMRFEPRTVITGVDESYRWLIGEGSPLDVIRDMRNPACTGHPGKVSDWSFVCNPDYDGGGVHINSGVLSHAFTLLADGGTYNGVTVPAIGLSRAAHLYKRSLLYHTPTSDFGGHAAALRRACRDLVFNLVLPVRVHNTGPTGYELFGPSDCDALDFALDAVEIEDGPGRCG